MKIKKSKPQKIPVLDLNYAAFQRYHGGVCLFNADDRFFELSARYNQNEPTPVLDFVNCQRQLKAQLLALKGNTR